MRVRAKVAFPYDARNLETGEEIDMPERYARVLQLVGKVDFVGDDEAIIDKRPRHRYGRRDMRADK